MLDALSPQRRRLVLGVVVSGALTAFVSPTALRRIVPRNRPAAVVAAGVLAAGVELAPLEDEAPRRRQLRFATASRSEGSLPPPHAASTSAPLPAKSDVRNLRRTAS